MWKTRKIKISGIRKPGIDVDTGEEIIEEKGEWFLCNGEYYMTLIPRKNGRFYALRILRISNCDQTQQ